MWEFRIQRNTKSARGGFFPEQVDQEVQQFAVQRAKTMGYWQVQRLVSGDLPGVEAAIQTALAEYDFTRRKHPEITSFRLFQDMPSLEDTQLEYMDYSGSIQSITRESVMIEFDDGQFRALNRNTAVGFRGIVRKARAPWSQSAWVFDQFKRAIVQAVAQNIAVGRIHPGYVRQVIEAKQRQLAQERAFAFAEYRRAYTDARLAAALAAHEAVIELTEALRIGTRMARLREMAIPLPVPDPSTVIELWKQGYLQTLQYQEYEPFIEQASPPGRRITFMRGAVLTNSKMIITITTNPIHETRVLAERDGGSVLTYVSYGSPPDGAVTISPGPRHRQAGTPQHTITDVLIGGWDGASPMPPAWSIVAAQGKGSELSGTVYTRVRRITTGQAALLAGFALDRPVVLGGTTQGFGNQAVSLLLPEMMLNVDVTPLTSETHELLPLDVGSSVTGQALRTAAGQDIFSGPYHGFTPRPVAGRPQRTGVMAELFG